MARRATSTGYEGGSRESDAQRRRRESRERARAREAWARTIADNENISIDDARDRAKDLERETADFETAVSEGLVDPETGNPTRRAKRQRAAKPKSRSKSTRRRQSARPRRRGSTARKVSRAATAPFGSAASAGWNFFSGGLSLVLLFVVLREAGSITAAADGLSAGVKRFADPYTPLVPSKGETTTPTTRVKTRVGGRRSGYSRGGLPGPGSPNDPRIQRG